jgi:putative oxidoreductase
LLLRVGAGIPLIYFASTSLSGTLGEPLTVVRDLVGASGGILLLAGLWTPLVGAVIATDELWIASAEHLSGAFSRQGDVWIPLFLAVISAGVAMLGPGAWSADAYLFGRKRFEIKDRPRGR